MSGSTPISGSGPERPEGPKPTGEQILLENKGAAAAVSVLSSVLSLLIN